MSPLPNLLVSILTIPVYILIRVLRDVLSRNILVPVPIELTFFLFDLGTTRVDCEFPLYLHVVNELVVAAGDRFLTTFGNWLVVMEHASANEALLQNASHNLVTNCKIFVYLF